MSSLAVTVTLISLNPLTTLDSFLAEIKNSDVIKPVILARVVQWMVLPTAATHLLDHTWDYLLILEESSDSETLKSLTSFIAYAHTIPGGFSVDVPSNFKNLNESDSAEWPSGPTFCMDTPLVFNSSQAVTPTPSLLAFAQSPLCPLGPVVMLNLISLRPYATSKDSYATYIDVVSKDMGTKRGGSVKLRGEMNNGNSLLPGQSGQWDEFLVVQYPSFAHFVDMAADPEYQAANFKYRMPALRDTVILMCTEVKLDWKIEGGVRWESK